MIRFRPGKLRTKPDALTRQWDVYPKEGERSYAAVNPHNFRPVFTNEQLASSLRATVLYTLVLRATTIMDLKALHSDICSTLHSDPSISEQLSNLTLHWTIDPTGLLHLDNHIYVPDSKNLQLQVLQYKHDHPMWIHFEESTSSMHATVLLQTVCNTLVRGRRLFLTMSQICQLEGGFW